MSEKLDIHVLTADTRSTEQLTGLPVQIQRLEPGNEDVQTNYTLYPVQTQFFTNAMYGQDQLRQRVAFALHQIFVVSGVDIGQGYPSRFTPYLQVLQNDAFRIRAAC